MKKNIFVIFGLVLFLAVKVYAYNDGDFQVWLTTNEDFKINSKSKITLEEEFRWENDASILHYQHYDAGFVYDVNKNFTLGINYRQVYERRGGDFKAENRPHFNATGKWDILGFRLEDRNRIEYRHFDYEREDFWRYRNKISLKFPWKLTKFEIQPYLADEVFINTIGTAFAENRGYAGLGFSVIKNFVNGEIYYMRKSNNSTGGWIGANVLGVKAKIIF